MSLKISKIEKKHGTWFEEAKTVFEGAFARVFYDKEHLKKRR